jgi:hypothetical protein
MGLTINLVWDSKALAAPQSFRNGIEQAAAILEAAITTPITVNIAVGYGEYDLGGGSNYQVLNSDYSLGGVTSQVEISYDALTAAMASVASSATDRQVVSSLPATSSLNGQSNFYISNSVAKAFGALAATGTEIDGNTGFPASFTGSVLVTAGIVEILHAMGLLNSDGPESLVEYTSAGHHFVNGGTTSTPAYFSVDGGVTNLANYDVGYDSTLFENLPNDPLDVPDTGVTTLTSLDLEEIGAIGFNTNFNESLPSVSITPAVSKYGIASIAARNRTIAENGTIAVTSFISSVTASSSAGIVGYEFLPEGLDTGYFTIDGVRQPAGRIEVLSTQLNNVDYVGGSTLGSETYYAVAEDGATDELVDTTFTVTTAAGIALCFAAGTHIRTPDGELLVENLAVGDLVTTHAGPRPIKWIGRRCYEGRFIGQNHLILPILLRPHAIAENCPSRDLWVSPGHGICVSDSEGKQVLVPAWRLINGTSIVQVAHVERIDYFHIELEEHSLLFAENLPAESFFEIEGFRNQFQNASEFDSLYPGHGAPKNMCLPRIEDGFALQEIQNRLARRAGLPVQRESPSLNGFRGAYDLPGDGCVTGWAQAESQPGMALTIAVKINGRWAAYGLANRYRQDLRDAGIGDGCHGFTLALPEGATGPIEVCHALTGTPLNFSSETVETGWVSAA